MSLLVRGFAVWVLLLLAAIANGAVRQAWLVPWLGDATAHVASTIGLSLIIFGIVWALSGWLDIADSREAWMLGAAWIVLTLAFEFLGGRFLFGASWEKLLADYNLAQGRIWVLVLVSTLLTPRVVYSIDRRS